MSVLSRPYFYDEAKAFEHVEGIIWPDGPTCPHCGNAGKVYVLKGLRSKPSKKNPEGIERHGVKKCAECRKQFTVRIGTIFEDSPIPLHKWLQAIHLMCSSKKGISSHQLSRVLEITVKSAWFLSHRIREAMRSDDLTPLGGNGKAVEVDETYFGRVKGFEKIGGPANKHVVLTLVEREGRARSFHIHSATSNAVWQVVSRNIDRETALMTDTAQLYPAIGKEFRSHGMVNHSVKEYARGVIHTNTIEGFFSIFKRGMKGIYQHCSEHHLHRYLAEFDFRYSNRMKLGVSDTERSEIALRGIVGRRLTYGGSATV